MTSISKDAILSSCKKYRYILERTWDSNKPKAVFVMLNPSTADHTVDDPTIRKCIGFAKRWGLGGISVFNVFAFRATLPNVLKTAEDPIGPLNQTYLEITAIHDEDTVVFSWGASAKKLFELHDTWISRMTRLFKEKTQNIKALGFTREGFPRHPLYVKYDQELVEWKSRDQFLFDFYDILNRR